MVREEMWTTRAPERFLMDGLNGRFTVMGGACSRSRMNETCIWKHFEQLGRKEKWEMGHKCRLGANLLAICLHFTGATGSGGRGGVSSFMCRTWPHHCKDVFVGSTLHENLLPITHPRKSWYMNARKQAHRIIQGNFGGNEGKQWGDCSQMKD